MQGRLVNHLVLLDVGSGVSVMAELMPPSTMVVNLLLLGLVLLLGRHFAPGESLPVPRTGLECNRAAPHRTGDHVIRTDGSRFYAS